MLDFSYYYYAIFTAVALWSLLTPWKRGIVHACLYAIFLISCVTFLIFTADKKNSAIESIFDSTIVALLIAYLMLNLKSGAWKKFFLLKGIGVNASNVDTESKEYKFAHYVLIIFWIACFIKAAIFGL